MQPGKHKLGGGKKAPPRPEELAAMNENNTADKTDSDNTTERPKSMRGNAVHKGLATHLRKAGVLRTVAARITKIVGGDQSKEKGSSEMNGWADNEVVTEARDTINAAAASIIAAAAQLEGLGPNFVAKPTTRRSTRAAKLEQGTKVTIRADQLETYEGIVSEEELTTLYVLEHTGKTVVLKSTVADSDRLVMARAHVEPIPAG